MKRNSSFSRGRWKWWILSLLVVTALFVYGWIPATIRVSRLVTIPNNQHGIYRNLSDSSRWKHWWIGKPFELHGSRYALNSITPTILIAGISHPLFDVPSSMVLVTDSAKHTVVQWSTAIPATWNPVTRIRRYSAAQSLAADLQVLLQSMQQWYTDTAHLYDLTIRRERVNDSLLVFMQDSVKGYPSMQKVYSMVDELRKYIAAQGAQATDSPMLNVFTTDSSWFLTRVALPASKRLPGNNRVRFKWMLGGGNILEADVTGDQSAAQRAMLSVENYMQDYNLQAPAIPYYSLITHRLAEKDSSKWKTRICYPVMYYND